MRTCGSNYQDPKSSEALLEWLGPANPELLGSWLDTHAPQDNVPQIMNLGHAKSVLLQIGTQLVLLQCLEDMLDVVEVLFPSLAEDQDVIQVHYYKQVGEWP